MLTSNYFVRCLIVSLMECTSWYVTIVRGHPNLVRIYSYINFVIISTILVLSVFASTHLIT